MGLGGRRSAKAGGGFFIAMTLAKENHEANATPVVTKPCRCAHHQGVPFLPATEEFFSPDKFGSYGLRDICKVCRNRKKKGHEKAIRAASKRSLVQTILKKGGNVPHAAETVEYNYIAFGGPKVVSDLLKAEFDKAAKAGKVDSAFKILKHVQETGIRNSERDPGRKAIEDMTKAELRAGLRAEMEELAEAGVDIAGLLEAEDITLDEAEDIASEDPAEQDDTDDGSEPGSN